MNAEKLLHAKEAAGRRGLDATSEGPCGGGWAWGAESVRGVESGT